MTSSTRRWFTRLVAAVALWPASAEAQTMARSFEELMGIVKAEETVIVIDMRGRRVKGALTAANKDSFRWRQTAGPRRSRGPKLAPYG